MQQIVPGVWALGGLKMGRSYLVEGDDGIALIDTSSESASGRIVQAIESIGHRVEHIRAIVATHYHFDHTGNVRTLVERSGAKLLAHAADAPYIDGRLPWMPTNGRVGPLLDRFAPKPFSLPVDRELKDGDVLSYAGDLRVVHAPGHTPGNIALLADRDRLLFTGDALMNMFGLRLPFAASNHDRDQVRRTIAMLAALPFDTALPGHGPPIINRANEKIADWAKRWL